MWRLALEAVIGSYAAILVFGATCFKSGVHHVPPPKRRKLSEAEALAWSEVEEICAAFGLTPEGLPLNRPVSHSRAADLRSRSFTSSKGPQ